MTAVGKYLRSWRDEKSGRAGFMFWCPGCESPHSVVATVGDRPVWSFDGNVDRPTFSPSVLVFFTDNKQKPPKRITTCHLFVRDGQIEFLADSPHKLGGKTVPMQPFPPGLFGDGD